jgi:hypothetical protein
MKSSRYRCAVTLPATNPSPVRHSTASPTANRRASFLFAISSGVWMHARNPSLSSSWSRFLPMKTNLDSRFSSSAHGASKLPLKIMWTAWNMKRSSQSATFSTPFMRYRSVPLFTRR